MNPKVADRGKSAEDRWSRAREEMIKTQLISRGIGDERVLDAMCRVPRHRFVPEVFRDEAHSDRALPIGDAQMARPSSLLYTSGRGVMRIGAGHDPELERVHPDSLFFRQAQGQRIARVASMGQTIRSEMRDPIGKGSVVTFARTAFAETGEGYIFEFLEVA